MESEPFNLNKFLKKVKRTPRGIHPVAVLKRFVEAGGTSRIFRWLTEGTFAIVSANHKEKTPGQNAKDEDSLKAKVLSDGYGFYTAAGFYEGVQEDSLFIPDLPLEKALEYGRMFDPPQREVVWGRDGQYAFHRMDGTSSDSRSAADDFTILKEPEVKRIVEEEPDVGLTKVRRDPRTWTTDPRAKEWRERGNKRSYIAVSDPRSMSPMGNFAKVLKDASVSRNGDGLDYDNGKYGFSLGVILVALPFPVEEPE